MTLSAQWQAVQREAQLAAEQAAHGVTVLGRANHAQIGLYTQAFFGLSIGLERMGKLIFLADHAIRSGGAFPTDQDLRKIGHDLAALLAKCEAIGAGLSQHRDYMTRPSDTIHRGIEDVLSLFATKLRYYNLNHLAGTAQGQQDPVVLWWKKVATPICNRHYSQRQREKDEADAVDFESMFGDISFVIHSTEAGEPIRDVHKHFSHSRATRVVQKYGRLYTLQIVPMVSLHPLRPIPPRGVWTADSGPAWVGGAVHDFLERRQIPARPEDIVDLSTMKNRTSHWSGRPTPQAFCGFFGIVACGPPLTGGVSCPKRVITHVNC